MENNTMSELLTLQRMARRLGVTVRWLKNEAEAERVPCLRAESRFLFDPQTVTLALAERIRQKRIAGGDHAG